jgi:hypothetical protein
LGASNSLILGGTGAYAVNVGIGTTSPSAKLSITGTGQTTGRAFVISDSANLEKVTVLDNGNVGIGAKTPQGILHLFSGASEFRQQDSDADGVGAFPYHSFYDSNSQIGWVGDGSSNLDSIDVWAAAAASVIRMGTAGSERIRIDTNGNVGIGTSSPQTKLEIDGVSSDTAGSGLLSLGYTGDNRYWTTRLATTPLADYAIDRYYASAWSEAMRIQRSTGNVGIGTTSPYAKLSIQSTAGGTTPLFSIASSSALYATSTVFSLDSDGVVNNKYGIFCELYISDRTTPLSVPTGTTYTKSFALASTTLTETKYCNADPVNSQITITKAGKYRVEGSFSMYSETNNVEFRGATFVDGIEQHNLHWARKITTANDIGNAGFTGFITATSSTVVDYRIRHLDGGSVNMTTVYGDLNVEYIGN